MSTSHEQAALFYVVSRSGKILGSEDLSRRFVEADYFEGELEGWIFWGSSKRGSVNSVSKRLQDVSNSGSVCEGLIRNTSDSLTRMSWQKRTPFALWGDETKSLDDVFSPFSWRQTKSYWSKNTARKASFHRRWDADTWIDNDAGYESSLSGPSLPQVLYRSERCYGMDQNVKIGLSQLAILRKWDIDYRWEPGTRELAARWAAWLLKVLRKNRPRSLQHLLFTKCAGVLPVICCSLLRERWTRVADPELFRCVDIVWKALEKSCTCFSPAQWEILEERLIECRQLRLTIGSLTEKYPRRPAPMEILENSQCKVGMQSRSGLLSPFGTAAHQSHQPSSNVTDEQLSNSLLHSEGVSALVNCALHEKLFMPQSKLRDGKGDTAFSGDSGTIVSLVCPLSGRRVKIPARGRGCTHSDSFDLEAYLEEQVKNDLQRCSLIHERKKPKMETGAWCCPICGSDATWPQIIVDRLLLRILEVLPEGLSQICLLPNGRWRVVWNPGGEGRGKMGTNSTEITLHPPFQSGVNRGIYHVGQFGEMKLDAWKTFDRGGGVVNLERAYRAWKDGVGHLAKGGTSKHIEVQWDAESTVAVWTGDCNSKMDSLWQASARDVLNFGETDSTARKEIEDGSITRAEVLLKTVVSKDIVRAPEAADGDAGKIEAEDDAAGIGSHSKLILEALQALGGITLVYNGTEGVCARVRVGQPKARRKLMAKKV